MYLGTGTAYTVAFLEEGKQINFCFWGYQSSLLACSVCGFVLVFFFILNNNAIKTHSISRDIEKTMIDPNQDALNFIAGDFELPFETRVNLHRYSYESSLTEETSNKVQAISSYKIQY